jgi:zinc transport system ATP-binding protein
MSTDVVIDLQNVSYWYENSASETPVLDRVSMRVVRGDFVGLIGPNGGGKTTLLRILLGQLKPQQGTVRVLGNSPELARRKIGYVPQHARVDTTVPATVLDVVLMGRLCHSSWGLWFGKRDTDAAMRALEQTATADLAKRPIGSLSGGQRQRVLIARALASDAELLLLDEPTAGVDAHIERGLTELLHQLNETMPIVLVSHDVTYVSTHLKHVACLNRRMHFHAAEDVTHEVIANMYAAPLRVLEHEPDCPLSDQGCDHEHAGHAHSHPHAHEEPR